MSELMNVARRHGSLRNRLLADVSVIALLSFLSTSAVQAEDQESRPTVWIELGGQLSALTDGQEPFAPSFVPSLAQDGVLSPVQVQSPPRYSLETDGKLSFQPGGGDWVFSASVRYGRSASSRKQHQQTPNKVVTGYLSLIPKVLPGLSGDLSKYPSSHVKFADASAKQSERYLILDFQAGKDVGVGTFGGRGSSTISTGIRIAQFTSSSTIGMHLEPDVHYPTAPINNLTEFLAFRSGENIPFHDFSASASFARSFQGIGPSIAWHASMPVAGDTNAGKLAVDWGVNGALLFGRQKVSGKHQTATKTYVITRYKSAGTAPTCFEYKKTSLARGFCFGALAQHNHPLVDRNRVTSVVVPNIGGSVGLSYRIEDFKVSFGYRADFFFGAMDGGIDTRKTYNRNFYGPFASISVGLGG